MLCNEVLGISNSAELIAEVVGNLVFVAPVNQQHGQFRFHHLFSESAQRIAVSIRTPEHVRRLRTRAGAWFERNGNREQALTCFMAAGDWHRCTPLLVSICRELADQDLFHSIVHWLEQVPPGVRMGDIDLAYWYTFSLAGLGRVAESADCIAQMESTWMSHPGPVYQGRTYACKGMVAISRGDVDEAYRLSRESLAISPEPALVERLHALHGIIEIANSLGQDETADEAFAAALDIRRRLPNDQRWWNLHTQAECPNQLELRGDLVAARTIYLQIISEHSGYLTHPLRKLHHRVAEISFARNELEDAQQHLTLLGQMDLPFRGHWYVSALMTRARIARATGNLDLAESVLDQAIEIASKSGIRADESRARASLASLWIKRGDLALARHWANQVSPEDDHWARIFGATNPRLVLIELLLAEGGSEEADREVARLIEEGNTRKRWAELVRVYAYKTVLDVRAGNRRHAARSLHRAVVLGQRDGFVRHFFMPFFDVSPMLAGLPGDGIDRAYVAHVEQEVRNYHEPQGMVSLSKREIEILKFARLDLPNRAIAERLFISEPTVKRHLANINLKLSSRSREEAIERPCRSGSWRNHP